jgi:DNA-directed RNA polymerase specialized sigma24 family protein
VIDAIELDLIRDARAGDAEAFDALIGPLLQPGYSLALGMLHDREAAQDAVQEASLKAWRKLSQLRAGSEIRPWFLAIVANQCRTTLRGSWWRVLKVPIFAEREDPAGHKLPLGREHYPGAEVAHCLDQFAFRRLRAKQPEARLAAPR